MKKIAVLVAVAILNVGTCFADTFAGGEKLAENFLSHGSYIKVILDSNNIVYHYKNNSVIDVRIDEDDIKIIYTDGDSIYELKKYDIVSDSSGNIIISLKQKKK